MNPKLPQFTIYCVTCLVNEKKYIGKTAQAIWTRWAAHLRNAREFVRTGKCRSGAEITSDLAKYGDDSFKLEILEVCLSQAQMDERELWWMVEMKSIAPHGYNHHIGDRVIHKEGRFDGRECLSRRKVLAVKDSQILHFKSLKEFCEYAGIHRSTVCRNLKKGLTSMNGFNITMEELK